MIGWALKGSAVVLLALSSCKGPESESTSSAARNGRIRAITTVHDSGARPRFSPDGSRIVFDRQSANGFYNLYTSDIRGGSIVSLTEGRAGLPQRHNGNGIFDASGQFILFISEENEHFATEARGLGDPGIGLYSNLWATTPDGRELWRLTNIPIKRTLLDGIPSMATVNPVLSRDGGTLVWTERFAEGGGSWGRWRLKAAAFVVAGGVPSLTNERVVYTPVQGNYVTAMAFLDPGRLAIAGNLEGQQEYGMDQYVLELATSRVTNLTSTPLVWEEDSCVAPSGQIAYMSNIDSQFPLDFSNPNWPAQPRTREYYLMNADGGAKERLTYFNDPDAPERSPRRAITAACDFSPDGRYLAGTQGIDTRTDGLAAFAVRVILIEFATPFRNLALTARASPVNAEIRQSARSGRSSPRPIDVAPSGNATPRRGAASRDLGAPRSPEIPSAGSGRGAPRAIEIAAAGTAVLPWLDRIEQARIDGELRPVRVQRDTMFADRVHERFAQFHEGVPVFGGYVVRQRAGRSVLTVFGRLFEGIDLSVVPVLTSNDAIATGAAAAGGRAVSSQLGVLPRDGGGYTLAYRVVVRRADDVILADVNANTGAIEWQGSTLRGWALALTSAPALFGRRIDSSLDPGSGVARPVGLAQSRVFDFGGRVSRLMQFLETGRLLPSDEVTGSTTRDTVIADVTRVQVHVDEYLRRRFGRAGVDDVGSPPVAIVHPAALDQTDSRTKQFALGTWYAGNGVVLYGDGDVVRAKPLGGALDVVARQAAYGVLEFSSGLSERGESAELADGFADVLAAGIDHFVSDGRVRPWVLGEQVAPIARAYLRSLITNAGASPVAPPTSRVADAFFHAATGAPAAAEAERVARMERVFYRAFVYYLGPSATIHSARAATLQAAVDLSTADSADWDRVRWAWQLAGVE